MFSLVHNIDFVISAIFVLLIIYFSVGKKYSKISQSNRMFYNMVNTAMIQSMTDICYKPTTQQELNATLIKWTTK